MGREKKRRRIQEQWPGRQHCRHMKKSKHKSNYVPCKPPSLDVSANLRSTPYQLFDISGHDDEAPTPFGPDPTGWFHLPHIPVLPTVYRWCYEKVSATLTTAVDVIFPNQHYKRELASTRQRLQELEAELESVRAEMPKTGKGPNVPKYRIPTSTQTEGTDHCSQTMPPCTIQAAPLTPPPPPPPPPPVIVQKPVRIVTNKKKNMLRESTSKPVISLEDIKRVRLKKPEDRSVSVVHNESISYPKQQLLCPERLKPMVIKPTADDTPLNLSPVITGIKRRPLKGRSRGENRFDCVISEVKDYKNKLRKVAIDRSPGGTPRPNKKKRLETGTGLTPMIARALKNKFLFARSPSPLT